MTIQLFNPRLMMRGGVSKMMEDVIAGHTVILRAGEIAPAGVPLLVNPRPGVKEHLSAGRDRVFKLVEVSAAELKRLEKQLAQQHEDGIPFTSGSPTRAANPNRADYPKDRKPRAKKPAPKKAKK